jgi:hypothetical protein
VETVDDAVNVINAEHRRFVNRDSISSSIVMLNFRMHLPVYSPFGDGEGQGYTICRSFDVCQSHQQKSAAQMPQIFDHRLMSVSHTTRNLRHICHKIFLNLSVV